MSKKLLVNSLLVLSLCVASCACTKEGGKNEGEGSGTEIKTLYNKSAVLKNPLNGWVMYINREGVPAYWDTEHYVPELSKKVKMKDYATCGYLRTSWRLLNPAEGVYAWREEDNATGKIIRSCIAAGMPIAFRIVVDGADQGYNTPKWVMDKGVAFEAQDGNTSRPRPYPQDPIFQAEYEKLIKELAKDFDDPKKCAFIDAYGLGKWGEAHGVVYGTTNRDQIEKLKKEVLDWITSVYADNFKNVPLVINYHRVVCDPASDGNANAHTEELLELAINKGYSLRSDAFGMTDYYKAWEKNFAAKWNFKRPIIMEGGWITGGTHRYWIDPSGKYVEGKPGTVRQGEFDDSKEARVNMMDFRSGADGEHWFTYAFPLVQRFVQEGGYRLYPYSLNLPQTMSANANVKVSHSWRNMGWGYFPNNIPQWGKRYKPALALLDASGNVKAVFVDTEAEPSEWLKDKNYVYSFTVNPAVPAGNYVWAVAMVDTKDGNKPAIEIALNNEKTESGWHKLVSVEVK